MPLKLEIALHIQDAAHIAHGAAAHLLDAAVVGPVLPAVRVGEHHMQVRVGGQEPHPLDLVGLGGEKRHKLPQGVCVVIDHLPHQQVVIAVRIVVHRHKLKGKVPGDPPVPPAEHHIGHIKNAVGVHIVVDGGSMGALRVSLVIVQHRLPVSAPGVAQAGLIAIGTDVAGLGGIQRIFIAHAVAHLVVKRGIKGMQAADGRARLGVVPHQHL